MLKEILIPWGNHFRSLQRLSQAARSNIEQWSELERCALSFNDYMSFQISYIDLIINLHVFSYPCPFYAELEIDKLKKYCDSVKRFKNHIKAFKSEQIFFVPWLNFEREWYKLSRQDPANLSIEVCEIQIKHYDQLRQQLATWRIDAEEAQRLSIILNQINTYAHFGPNQQEVILRTLEAKERIWLGWAEACLDRHALQYWVFQDRISEAKQNTHFTVSM